MKKILLCLLSVGLSTSLFATGDVSNTGPTMTNTPNATTEMSPDTDPDAQMNTNEGDVNQDAGVSTDSTTPGTTNEPPVANPEVNPGR